MIFITLILLSHVIIVILFLSLLPYSFSNILTVILSSVVILIHILIPIITMNC